MRIPAPSLDVEPKRRLRAAGFTPAVPAPRFQRGGTPPAMVTVVPREQAPKRRRAVIASIIGLGLATGLAAILISDRRAVHLGERLAPARWPVSFRLPADWTEYQRGQDTIECRDLRDARNPRQCIVHLLPKPPDASAAEIALQVMSLHFASLLGSGPPAYRPASGAGRLPTPEDVPLGPLPGAQVNLPASGDYVHVGIPPSDGTRVVILRYHTAGPFTERDIQACRRIAESFESADQP
ncbi:MAG: hypothetical protein V2A79_03490 [Planctomycetota bacterium]